MSYWNLIKKIMTAKFRAMSEFKKDSLIYLALQIAYYLIIFFFFKTIFGFTNTIVGWNFNEVMFLFFINQMPFETLFTLGLNRFGYLITSGELNIYLIKPKDTITLFTFWEINYHNLIFWFIALIFVISAFFILTVNLTFISFILGFIAYIFGIISFLFINSSIKILSFKYGNVEDASWLYRIIQGRFAEYPTAILSKPYFVLISFLFPPTVVTLFVPALIFLNKINLFWSIILTILLGIYALLCLILFRRFFYKQLKNYEGYS
jgi:ABC-type uncharacterized transport system permease subunit